LVWDAGGPVGLSGAIAVEPGEVAAIVAAPVAGAALADVLVGLTPPVDGTACIDGHWSAAARPDPGLVSLVPVGAALLPQRTVAQNIAFGNRITANPRARENRVVELATRFQVAGVLRLHPHRLSPAQRLGVAAARALGSEPHAVVVEDRAGQPDCRAVVAALAGHDVAVIVITDRADRARELTAAVYRAEPVPPEPRPGPAPVEPSPLAVPAPGRPGAEAATAAGRPAHDPAGAPPAHPVGGGMGGVDADLA
jgi:ABC-type thiamine transport system ATPase subunit